MVLWICLDPPPLKGASAPCRVPRSVPLGEPRVALRGGPFPGPPWPPASLFRWVPVGSRAGLFIGREGQMESQVIC